ncbi:hypothetical protein IVA80_10955 [Bradyrhizobium sp. 139]|uniref:hypothetical protein n=1 Tax=Bradyrhizobium sp. 139 TaxID=2782616 RepID=UPI001FF9800A|nr:hypothetical protein [Bradyrhizobium sp. 139]MCK1741369.1 hypothetical protein [Bradyrhizobium sp. 139]
MAEIKRGSDVINGDRYKYDLRLCKPSDGWAQLDTRQDAPYYGTWVNPVKRELFNYCEGDLTHTLCSDDADFTTSLRACIDWNRERDYFIGIDPCGEETIRAELIRLGFEADLHWRALTKP